MAVPASTSASISPVPGCEDEIARAEVPLFRPVVPLIGEVVASQFGRCSSQFWDGPTSSVKHAFLGLAAIEPNERGLAIEIRIGTDYPIGDDRPRHIVAKQQCHDVCDVLADVVMLELVRGVHLFGQPGADAENVVATEQTIVGTTQILSGFGSCPKRTDENDSGVWVGCSVVFAHGRTLSIGQCVAG